MSIHPFIVPGFGKSVPAFRLGKPALMVRKAGEILTLRSKLNGTMSIVLAASEVSRVAISSSVNPAETQKECLAQWLSISHA